MINKLLIVSVLLLLFFYSCKKNQKKEVTLDPSIGVSTFAGNGTLGYLNGAATSAEFSAMANLAFDATGNLYVSEGDNVIRKITPAGTVSTYAGLFSSGGGYANGAALSAQFHDPQGLAFDKAGNLYICDSQNNVIRRITSDGIVSTFAGVVKFGGGYKDGAALMAEFNLPCALVFDAAGNLYVADYFNAVIRKITPAGMVSTIVGKGIFAAPTAIAIDASGILYVSDQYNKMLVKVTSTGVVSTFARGFSSTGLVFDNSGNLYATNYQTMVILKITPDGTVTTLAGKADVAGFVNGPLLSAEFSTPEGMSIDATGNLYVIDYNNFRIRKIIP